MRSLRADAEKLLAEGRSEMWSAGWIGAWVFKRGRVPVVPFDVFLWGVLKLLHKSPLEGGGGEGGGGGWKKWEVLRSQVSRRL